MRRTWSSVEETTGGWKSLGGRNIWTEYESSQPTCVYIYRRLCITSEQVTVFGANSFVPCGENVPISEVKININNTLKY